MKKLDTKLALKLGLTIEEIALFRSLNSPIKVQDFLQKMPANFERKGETLSSPHISLKRNSCHCFEGALIGALSLWLHGEKPLILDLKAKPGDFDHIIVIFKQEGFWGALSKTNHSVLRYRDPIYKTLRELIMSYFHEYTEKGKKNLVSYSVPYDLRKIKKNWVTTKKNLWFLDRILNKLPHHSCVLNKKITLRLADKIEQRAGDIIEYQ